MSKGLFVCGSFVFQCVVGVMVSDQEGNWRGQTIKTRNNFWGDVIRVELQCVAILLNYTLFAQRAHHLGIALCIMQMLPHIHYPPVSSYKFEYPPHYEY